MNFRGTFEYALDAKHRLTIPVKYRDALKPGATLVLWPATSPHTTARSLAIWPSDAYETFTKAALKDANPLSAAAQEMTRLLHANAWDLDIDAAHRLMIPAPAIEFAKLTKDVVITGSGEFLEVWDRDAHAEYNAELLRRFPEIAASFDHAG